MLKDRYGNPVSTASQAALAHYDDALDLIRLYRGDPIAALDAALAEDPDFGGAWAARAGLLVQQTDKAYAEETAKSLRAGGAAKLNESRTRVTCKRRRIGRKAATMRARRGWRASLRKIRAISWRCNTRTSAASSSACRQSYATGRCKPCAPSARARTATATSKAWLRSALKNAVTMPALISMAAKPSKPIRAMAGPCMRWRTSTKCAAISTLASRGSPTTRICGRRKAASHITIGGTSLCSTSTKATPRKC